jgi:putative colanic acid biosynthesis UDP-glucose lipid carrier transferase
MSTLTRFLFFFGDLVFLNLAIFASFNLAGDNSNLSDKVYLFIFSNLAWLYLTLVANPYNINKTWSLSKAAKTQLAFLLIHVLVVTSLILFLRKHYALIQIGFIYLIFVPVFFLWKILIYYLRKVFTKEISYKNFVLIGRNTTSTEIRKYYLSNSELRYRFLGYVEAKTSEQLIEKIREINLMNEVHEVFCCTQDMSNEALKPLIDFGLDSLIKVRVAVDSGVGNQDIIQLDRLDQELGRNVLVIPLDEPHYQFIKRGFDLIFSITFILLIMSWLLPIIAIIIMVDSRGPIFFVQLRSGKDNRPFKCLKFRTMKVNADSDSKQATKNDPRITRLGAFLRKSSIDELPQFFNVFIGNMSVIGPRPHMLKHTEEYAILIEKFMGRHYVKPGITGLAQCMGYRGETQTVGDMENRVRLDRYYIENWTFWLDIKIIFLTIISLIRGSDKAF